MRGKLVATVAFVGMAILAAPVTAHAAMDEMSAQGAGMSIPGTSANAPGAGTAQGPVVQNRRAHKRHAKRHKQRAAR